FFDLLAFCGDIAALHGEGPVLVMLDTVHLVLGFVLFWTKALNRKQRILRTAIPFFANSRLLPPQVAVDGIALGQFVEAIALRETQAAAIGELAQQGEYLPLQIR